MQAACGQRLARPSPARAACRTASARGRRSMRVAAVANVTEAVFEEEVLQSPQPVLVDFWAPWCGPCKLMAPFLDVVEKEYNGALKVVKIEHGTSPSLIEKYKVYGLPTFIIFKDGQEVAGSKREGAITKAQLLQYVKQHMDMAAVPAQ